jgi:cytochrome c oxidase subunit 2
MRLRNRIPTRLLAGFGIMCLLLLAAGCTGHDPQDTLNPQGHIAAVTKALFYPVFWIAVAVFIFVEGLLLFILVRFRDHRGRQMPVQTHGHTGLELTWTAIPTLMLLGIAIPTIATLVHVDTTPANAMEIKVVAHQWWWEFDYPNDGIVTADELHIPAGVPVHVSLHSNDVIHSFWVPTLAGKQDVIPNHDGGMWFSAYQPGTFDGQCAQFCGEQHALMQFRVVAQSQSDFASWVSSQKATASTTSLPQSFDTNGCSGCHTIAGTSAAGTIGPNLTHFASRAWFEEMENNPDDVTRWIKDPQGIKHGNDMKIGQLSPQDTQSLLNLLESLK